MFYAATRVIRQETAPQEVVKEELQAVGDIRQRTRSVQIFGPIRHQGPRDGIGTGPRTNKGEGERRTRRGPAQNTAPAALLDTVKSIYHPNTCKEGMLERLRAFPPSQALLTSSPKRIIAS